VASQRPEAFGDRNVSEDRESSRLVMTYRGIYERAEDGTIWGRTDEFDCAFGAGDTLEEAQASLREGIRLWIEADIDFGFGHVEAMPDELLEIVDLSELEYPELSRREWRKMARKRGAPAAEATTAS
jgi:predicted RNase H-like HicB family nuclease